MSRKVTRGVAAIVAGQTKTLRLGNLHASRDWGHARDYVEAMWLMLQQERPGDYVIASGIGRSVSELVEVAFGLVGLDWKEYVEVDQTYVRPADVSELCGDASKARRELGWVPKTSFEDMIREMLESDLRAQGLDAAWYLQPAVSIA